MADAKPKVSERRRFSPIWIVPAVALLLGLWMLIYTYQNQGPEIEIVFPTASGIDPMPRAAWDPKSATLAPPVARARGLRRVPT